MAALMASSGKPDDANFAPELEPVLRGDDSVARLRRMCSPLGSRAFAMPVLSATTCAAMEDEIRSCLANRPADHLRRLTIDSSTAEVCPVTTRIARRIAAELLPAGVAVLGHPGARLCEHTRAFVLQYTPGGGGGITDGDRVFRPHVDDSDVTVNVAIGSAGGWSGSDLVYIESSPDRPGTPDAGCSQCARHTHVVGTAVLHGEGAYQYVEPLRSGERLSLVVLAMRDDAPWKRTYYSYGDDEPSRT